MFKRLWRRRVLFKAAGISIVFISSFWMFWNILIFHSRPRFKPLLNIQSFYKGNTSYSSARMFSSVRKFHENYANQSKSFLDFLEFLRSNKTLAFKGSFVEPGRKMKINKTDLYNMSSAILGTSSFSKKTGLKYYLSEILMVRIYKHDKAKWTIRELKQWMHYLFFAGIEHIYLCDHYVLSDERLEPLLSKYIDKGLLTYIDWPWNASANLGRIMAHQVHCYDHVTKKYGADSMWQTSIDMDEYPFCGEDVHKGFLSRYLKQYEKKSISQILMENYLMLGQGDRTKTMTIERINRITKKIANKLTKPIFRPKYLSDVGIHTHHFRHGASIYANVKELRMLHYWGARPQNWGPDTNKTLEITEPFPYVVMFIAPMVRRSLISFGEFDAFSNVTGP